MKRKTNQDSILVDNDQSFFVVADGMGGHNGGDIASQMSIEILPDFIKNNKNDLEPIKLLDQAVHHVNNEIYKHAKINKDLEGMGTTISGIYFDKEHLFITNIGDSRVYLIQNKKLYQITRDHSLVQERLNMGFYDRSGAKKDPQKNVLIKTVGFEKDVHPDVYQYKLKKNDLFLICSDGLHGKVADPDIVHILQSNIGDFQTITQEDLDSCVSALIQQANANGGQDNISVILSVAK